MVYLHYFKNVFYANITVVAVSLCIKFVTPLQTARYFEQELIWSYLYHNLNIANRNVSKTTS